MRHSKMPLVLAAVTIAVLALAALGRPHGLLPVPASSGGGGPQPVVLELFTSEGCSSCPPADAFLKALDDAGRVDNVEVIAIEEHVDYWDHLGWRDPFSSYKWTERQQQYEDAFHHDGAYTPQLVINGRSETTGGRQREALQKIAEAANLPAAQVGLKTIAVSSRSADFSIALGGIPPEARSAELWLAVTERGLSSDVLRGENGGHKLAHAAVLRSLTRVKLPHGEHQKLTEAPVSVPLEPMWRLENLRFVAFVQDSKTHHILGAAASGAPANHAAVALVNHIGNQH